MIKVFSYGTLCDKNVQLREFSQEFSVQSDCEIVIGYKVVKTFIQDGYYNMAVPSDSSLILGEVINIPEHLIEQVDSYETEFYQRKEVKTQNGVQCVMYIKNSNK